MSFTPEEKVTLAEMADLTPLDLDTQLTLLGVNLYPSVEEAIRVDIGLWPDAVASEDFSMSPMTTNYGVKLDPTATTYNLRYRTRQRLELDGGDEDPSFISRKVRT